MGRAGRGEVPAGAVPSARARDQGRGHGAPQAGAAMSVAFVPERQRGRAEVNQDTLQRVSETGPGRSRDCAEAGPDGAAGPSGLLGLEPAGAGRRPGRAVTALCAAAAGGERPADPVHRGVPEQGPRHRLRAVSDRRGREGGAWRPGVGNGSEAGSSS